MSATLPSPHHHPGVSQRERILTNASMMEARGDHGHKCLKKIHQKKNITRLSTPNCSFHVIQGCTRCDVIQFVSRQWHYHHVLAIIAAAASLHAATFVLACVSMAGWFTCCWNLSYLWELTWTWELIWTQLLARRLQWLFWLKTKTNLMLVLPLEGKLDRGVFRILRWSHASRMETCCVCLLLFLFWFLTFE